MGVGSFKLPLGWFGDALIFVYKNLGAGLANDVRSKAAHPTVGFQAAFGVV